MRAALFEPLIQTRRSRNNQTGRGDVNTLLLRERAETGEKGGEASTLAQTAGGSCGSESEACESRLRRLGLPTKSEATKPKYLQSDGYRRI